MKKNTAVFMIEKIIRLEIPLTILLFVAAIFAKDYYPAYYASLLLIFIIVNIGRNMRMIGALDNRAYQFGANTPLLFKRFFPSPFLQNTLMEYDHSVGMALFAIICQLAVYLFLAVSVIIWSLTYIRVFQPTSVDSEIFWYGCVLTLFILHSALVIFLRVIRWYLHKKYDKEPEEKVPLPEQIKYLVDDYKWNRKMDQHWENVHWQLQAKHELEKHLYIKRKGTLYIAEKDIDRIQRMLAEHFPKATGEITQNEKGKDCFVVYAAEDNKVIFQAPVFKQHKKC